jgi:hypothetical protein
VEKEVHSTDKSQRSFIFSEKQASILNQPGNMTARWELFLADIKKLDITKKHVFISYAWEGAQTPVLHERLTRLRSDLCAIGCDVTYDIFSFSADLKDEMKKAVDTSDVALMICTRTYKSKVVQGPSTNVGYEFELIMRKLEAPEGVYKVIPLLFSGKMEDAVPDQLRKILVRDCTCHSAYHLQLFGLSNPLGIVPAMLDLQGDEEYLKVWNEYARSSKESAWLSLLRRIQDMPKVKPKIYISYAKPVSEGENFIFTKFLHKLRSDLSYVGHTTQLDICDNHGDRNGFMERGIAGADVILLVCTPLLVVQIAEVGSLASREYAKVLLRKDDQENPAKVFPILFEGDMVSAVPEEFKEYYVRPASDYESFLTSRIPPVGLIPSLLGIDESNNVYRGLLRSHKFMNVDNLRKVCGGYYGRSQELAQLRANFQETNIQTIYGVGGSGKTQLALQYAHHYRYNYSICRFIDATQLIKSVLEFAGAMGLEVPVYGSFAVNSPANNVKIQVPTFMPAVISSLYEQLDDHSWLLIFNNVPREADIESFLPSGTNALLKQHVLLTTRCPSLLRKAMVIKGFCQSDSLGFLQSLFPLCDQAELSTLSAMLGHSPYALKLVWLYMTKSGVSLPTYMEFLKLDPLNALNEIISDDEYGHRYPKALGLQYIASEEARKVVKVCLRYSGTEIPVDYVLHEMGIGRSELFELMKDLNSTSLIEEVRGYMIMHPLLCLLRSVADLENIGHDGNLLFSPNRIQRIFLSDCPPKSTSSASSVSFASSTYTVSEGFSLFSPSPTHEPPISGPFSPESSTSPDLAVGSTF